VERLNGEFNPTGADPGTNTHGAITYRIDPRTGQYIFSRIDLKPRGVFAQNTFQHPAPAAMSALGIPLLPAGRSVSQATMVQGRTARGPMIPLRPGARLSGMGCNCGGKCSSSLSGPRRRRRGLRGLGDTADTFINPVTGCLEDSDGNTLSCPTPGGGGLAPTSAGGVDPNTQIGLTVAAATGAPPLPGQSQPSSVNVSPGILQSIISAFTQKPVITVPTTTPPKATNTNMWLIGGGIAAALLILERGGKRR
jgi:hypothetical protein